MSRSVSMTRIGQRKILEAYADHYIVEERGFRVKLVGTTAIKADLLARMLVDEMDIQNILHLAKECGAKKDDPLPVLSINRLHRAGAFSYSIVPECADDRL